MNVKFQTANVISMDMRPMCVFIFLTKHQFKPGITLLVLMMHPGSIGAVREVMLK